VLDFGLTKEMLDFECWILNEKKCNSPASAENSRKRFHHEGRKITKELKKNWD